MAAWLIFPEKDMGVAQRIGHPGEDRFRIAQGNELRFRDLLHGLIGIDGWDRSDPVPIPAGDEKEGEQKKDKSGRARFSGIRKNPGSPSSSCRNPAG